MINKNFIQKALVLTVCSFSLIVGSSYASDLVNQEVDAAKKKLPLYHIDKNTDLPPVNENVGAAGISVANVKENEDNNGNVTIGIGARGIELLDTTVNTKNPIVKSQ